MAVQVRALVDGFDEFIGIDHHKKRCQMMIKDRKSIISSVFMTFKKTTVC